MPNTKSQHEPTRNSVLKDEEIITIINKNAKYSSQYKMIADFINRQKAEIERLKTGLKVVTDELTSEVITAKSEAIKEFAEKSKLILVEMFNLMIDDNEGNCIIENCKKHSSTPCMNEYCIRENREAWETKIDNLVKEMTEQ